MKVMNTKDGKFGKFCRKNGAFLVLGLVVVATCAAIYAGSTVRGNKNGGEINSQISLSGDENKWNSNYSQSKNAQQTDAPQASTSQSSQQGEQFSSSEFSPSSGLQQQQSGSQTSQRILFISPVNGKVLNKFSGSKPVKSKTMGDWRLHSGVDYAAEKGTAVRSCAEGIVSKIYNDAMWGTCVEIEHPNSMTSIYSSLSDKVPVEKGQKVASGQSIGTVSNTAKIESAEQSHVHLAIIKNGAYIDPESVITKAIGK